MRRLTQKRNEVAEVIKEQWAGVSPRTAREFKNALGVSKSIRLRQAEVVSLSTTENTATIKLSGSEVAGVPYFTCLPCPGYAVWVVTDGEDLFILDSMGPAPTTRVARTSNQGITNGTAETINFDDPMPSGSPGNQGFDYWVQWLTATNSRLRLPVPGIYSITGSLAFVGNASGRRYLTVERGDLTSDIARTDAFVSASTIVALNAACEHRVADATGAYLLLYAFQNATAGLEVKGDVAYSPFLTWTWRGPNKPQGS